MIPYEEMPECNEDLAKVVIDFPRLAGETADSCSCPCPIQEIIDYLHWEAETVSATDLVFIRTAKVAEQRYWIWRFKDEDRDECYVTVSIGPNGCQCIGYDQNWNGLTPEQFLLGDYHGVF